jgi:hypothetical protein
MRTRIKNGDRAYSPKYQRVIIVADHGEFRQKYIPVWNAISSTSGFLTKELAKGRREYLVDTSGIIYEASSFTPFPYPEQ